MGRGKKATKCSHLDRLLYAKGLCKQCYQSGYTKNRKPKNFEKIIPRTKVSQDSFGITLNTVVKKKVSFNSNLGNYKHCKTDKSYAFSNFEDVNNTDQDYKGDELVVDFKSNKIIFKNNLSNIDSLNNNILQNRNFNYDQFDSREFDFDNIQYENVNINNDNSTISNYSNFVNFK